MRKHRESFINSIDLKPPFVLIVGRKKSTIEKPGRFVLKREHPIAYGEWNSPVAIASLPIRQTVKLFIGGNLFATTTCPTHGKPAAELLLKRGKRKRVEIHLVKKYTQIEDAK